MSNKKTLEFLDHESPENGAHLGIMRASAPQIGLGRRKAFSGGGCHDNHILKGYVPKQYMERDARWVIRSCQNHNAQKSVINWVIPTYGRKKKHIYEGKSLFLMNGVKMCSLSEQTVIAFAEV